MPSRQMLAHAIRMLSMDAVQKAKSGHPGAPMGMADIAQVLWCDVLKHNPEIPIGSIEIVLCFRMAMVRCCLSLLH